MTRVIHHKAAQNPALAPNSLAAVQACIVAGADFVEVDITALANDDYLLVHDAVLEHETNGTGAVRTTPATAARKLMLRTAAGVAPQPAALLSDVVLAMQAAYRRTRLQLDFKDLEPFDDDEPLRRLIRLIEPLGDRVIVSSIGDWQLRKLHRLAPQLHLGFDPTAHLDLRTASADSRPMTVGAYGYLDDHPLAMRAAQTPAQYLADRVEALVALAPFAKIFYVRWGLLVKSLADGFNWADALHAHGIKLDAWTMDATNDMAMRALPALAQAGVDWITSNTPDAVKALLA